MGAASERGKLIAEMLPTGERPETELRLKPLDIGHVEVGDRVEIRMPTYDAKRFGMIEGKVAPISQRPMETTAMRPSSASTSISRAAHWSAGIAHPVKVGTETRASIVTRSKSVLEYVAEPILHPFRGGFGKR